MSELKPGWGSTPISRKWHWFDKDGMSLCRKIGFYRGQTETGNDNSADNCARCRKLLKSNAPAHRERSGRAGQDGGHKQGEVEMIGIVLSNEEAKKLEDALGAIERGHECGCDGSAEMNETCAVCQALADVSDIHLSNASGEGREV